MKGRRIFRWQHDQENPVSDGRLREPLPHRGTATIRLKDGVDGSDPIKVVRVTVFAPIGCSRNTQCGNAVMPKGVNIALTLDEDDVPCLTRLSEAVESVELRL